MVCGPSTKRKHGGCVAASGKTAGTGPPAPLVPVSCRYLLVNRCSFFFPSQKRQILQGCQKNFLGGKAKLTCIKKKKAGGLGAQPPKKLEVYSFSHQFHGTLKALKLNLAKTAD